jgi:hypothetical protein
MKIVLRRENGAERQVIKIRKIDVVALRETARIGTDRFSIG